MASADQEIQEIPETQEVPETQEIPETADESPALLPAATNFSTVWQIFSISENDSSKAICRICKSAISRGTFGRFSTSPLRAHAKQKHWKEWEAAEKEVEERRLKF